MNRLFLSRQLRRQGIVRDNKALSGIAHQLNTISPGISQDAKKRIANDIGFKLSHKVIGYRLAFGSAFAAFTIMVVMAQSALPGSPLYALKRGSEAVRVLLQPGFDNNTLKQRRADEQKKLIQTEKNDVKQTKKTKNKSDEVTKTEDGIKELDSDGKKIENKKTDGSGSGSTSGGFGTPKGSGSSNGGAKADNPIKD